MRRRRREKKIYTIEKKYGKKERREQRERERKKAQSFYHFFYYTTSYTQSTIFLMAQSSVKQLGEFFNKNVSHKTVICKLPFNSIRKQKKLLFILFCIVRRTQIISFTTRAFLKYI